MINSDTIASISLAVAVAAFGLAAFTLWRSDRNASAANLLAFVAQHADGWRRLIKAINEHDEGQADYEFAELANVLEIACVMMADNAIHSRSREVLDQLLSGALKLIDEKLDAKRRLAELQQEKTDYEYLRAELKRRRKSLRLRATT